ncbi:MAG TPA: DM13 domain-containing protein [Bryobacteraceae bacterium]|nr:DM13 domain-containing protein [Bryobacteraceae bacterium]
MTNNTSAWLLRRKWILAAAGLAVLVALWWAFRPEKLWITEKVNEAAPFDTSGSPQPLLTGRFEDKAHQTSGRATIYKGPGGNEYLRLTDFITQNAADLHIVLARSDNQNLTEDMVKGDLDSVDCGPLKHNQGDQNYNLPAATDLNKYDAVVIYDERLHRVFGSAKLAPF